MSDPLLVLDTVACARGDRLLFTQLSLVLGPGDAALVTGPNGVGKSSLVRIAAGLLPPFAGSVRCPARVALMADRTVLDPETTLRDALGFWAAIDDTRDRVEAALDTVGLASLRAVPIRYLSTGQRQRAALARVVASAAALWLLDEPANGLDTGAIAMLEEVIADHRRAGGAVLLATHLPVRLPDAQSVALAALAA